MTHLVSQFWKDDFEIIELKNERHAAKIAVNIGNTLFSFSDAKQEYLYFPFSLSTYQTTAKLAGNPFMHPWANRLEGDYIEFHQQKHHFPNELKSYIYRDGNQLPLHGLLLKTDKWKTIAMENTANLCCHTAELKFDLPDWLQIFPFKHTIQIAHILQDNVLRIETNIFNEADVEMPVSFGFHPYFHRTENATLTIPADACMELNALQLPVGKWHSKQTKWHFNQDTIALNKVAFDDGFQDLHFKDNQAKFSCGKVDVVFEKTFPFAQIYAPNDTQKPYVCIEPMTAATNALNKNSCMLLLPKNVFIASFEIHLPK